MIRTTGSAFVLSAFASLAAAQTADFDTLPEGTFAPTIVDGGITFSNLDNGLGGTPVFTVEQADANLTGIPGYTSPMCLGGSGYSPGPGAAFTRMITFEFSSGAIANHASIEIFEFASYPGNTITLDALLGASVVASDSVIVLPGFSIHHYALSVTGPNFDRLRVTGAGPQDNGAFFALIDHVVVGNAGPGSAFCAGDGSVATACPCGNTGASGKGCDNSAATGGASLTASGTTSPDTVVLTSSGELPTALSIFLQGDVLVPNGLPFGDGVRCLGGAIKRLYVKNAVGGTVGAPAVGDPSITAQSASLGDPIAPGSTRWYQTYYRDPNLAFCPAPAGNTWNVSNGQAITW